MKFIIENKYTKHIYAAAFHVLLGFVMLYIPMAVIPWYYFVLFSGLFMAVIKVDSSYVILTLAYSLSFEIIGRMLHIQPYIPWELTKYITIPLVILSLFIDEFRKSNILLGGIIVLLSIPGWLFGNDDFSTTMFAMMGITNTGFLLILFYNRKITLKFLLGIFRMIILPLLSILVYITLKTPTFDDVSFKLGSNFQTTGGFGSNQMSTVLGLGMLLLSMAIIIQKKLFGNYFIDLFLAGYFLFRGLLSFSRGGIMVAFLAFGVFFYFLKNSKILPLYKIRMKKINITKVFFIIVAFSLVFIIADNITHGALLLRYKGETGGTLRGETERSLNTMTTGRWDIMITDLKMWRDYPVFGVGGGNSTYLRPNYGYRQIVAHTESSRLLADQGMFGLLINLIILFYIPYYLLVSRNSVEKAFLLSLFVLGILTSFHASMRTFVTPFFVGLSAVHIYPAIYFKQKRKK